MTTEFTQRVSYRESAPTGDTVVPWEPGHLPGEKHSGLVRLWHAQAQKQPTLS